MGSTMNRQEIFNRVCKHLLTQMRQARDDRGCRYITSNGDRCAIGCLIPDNHPGLHSNSSVYILPKMYPDLMKLWDIQRTSDLMFLCKLQEIHDCSDPDDWEERLKQFAKSHRVNYE